MTLRLITGAIAVACLSVAPHAAAAQEPVQTPPNATAQRPAFSGQTRAPERKANVAFRRRHRRLTLVPKK
jgi:hypothetical protein